MEVNCSTCNRIFKTTEKTKGNYYKTCEKCRNKGKCIHGKRKSRCLECGGSDFCIHKKYKYQCKDCEGKSRCEHDRMRSQCKDCKGGAICKHNKRRTHCIQCGGGSLCIHKKRRERCAECKGNSRCKHNKLSCKECNLPLYLVHNQRSRINDILRSKNLKKTKRTIEYLDCTPIFLKEYLEKQMTPEMTWDNIHIDHIKPVSKFNLEDPCEFLQCCHYTNLRPLLAKDNLTKYNKWSKEDELNWKKNICGIFFVPISIPLE